MLHWWARSIPPAAACSDDVSQLCAASIMTSMGTVGSVGDSGVCSHCGESHRVILSTVKVTLWLSLCTSSTSFHSSLILAVGVANLCSLRLRSTWLAPAQTANWFWTSRAPRWTMSWGWTYREEVSWGGFSRGILSWTMTRVWFAWTRLSTSPKLGISP